MADSEQRQPGHSEGPSESYYLEHFKILHAQISDRFKEFSSVINPVLLGTGAFVAWLVAAKQPGTRLAQPPLRIAMLAAFATNILLFLGAYAALAYGYAYRRMQDLINDAQEELGLENVRRPTFSGWCLFWRIPPENLKPYIYAFWMAVPFSWILVAVLYPPSWSEIAFAGLLCWGLFWLVTSLIDSRYVERFSSCGRDA